MDTLGRQAMRNPGPFRLPSPLRLILPLAALMLALPVPAGGSALAPRPADVPPRQERTAVLYEPDGWSARVYDPASDGWIDLSTEEPIVTVVTGNLRTDSLAGPPNLRDQPDDMPLNNGVLIATSTRLYFYDPTSGSYVSTELPPGEHFVDANVADRRGEVLAVAQTANTALIYNATQNAWVQGPRLQEGLNAGFTQVSPTGVVVASRERALVFDAVRNDWVELQLPPGQVIQATGLPAMPEPGLTPIVLTQDSAYTYDGGIDAWKGHTLPGQVQSYAVAEASAVAASDQAVAVYDPVTNQWVQQDVEPGGAIPRNGVLASRNTAMAISGETGYFYSRTRHQWEPVPAPANESFSGYAIAENTGVFWTREGTAYLYDANRKEFVEASAPPNATIVGGTMNQNLAVLTTDEGVMVYDPGTNQWSDFPVPAGDIPVPPGAPRCQVSRFTTLLTTNTNAWVWNPGTHQFDQVQTNGQIRLSQTSENAAIVATDEGAYVYDPTLNQWSEIQTPQVNEPVAGVDTARNTVVARSEDNAWFYNRSTHEWVNLPAPQNETWNVQMALENTALVCSERHAAVWDPTRDEWVQLEAGGEVSVIRDGNSFMAVTEYSAFVYNRSRHEWEETDKPYWWTAQAARRTPVPCKPKQKQEEEEKPADSEAVQKPPPDDPDQVTVDPDPDPGAVQPPERSVVLVLDASGSMDEDNKLQEAKVAAKDLLNKLGNAEVALIVYYDCNDLQTYEFTIDPSQLEPIIDAVQAGGGTPLYKSIGMAYDLLEKKASTDSGDIVVLTDGGESCQDDEDRNRDAASSWSLRRIPWARRTGSRGGSASSGGWSSAGLVAGLGEGGAPSGLASRGPGPVLGFLGAEAAWAQQAQGQINLHVVGFQVPPEDEIRLQEMMDLAQGTYHPAGDVSELSRALETAASAEPAGTDTYRIALLAAVSLVALAAILFFVWQLKRRRRPAPAAGPAPARVEPPAAPPTVAAAGQLVVARGQAAQRTFALDSPVVVIGRSRSCELTVHDALVSRRHAEIHFQSGGPVLVDLGSRNGTFVNDRRLSDPHRLSAGDLIRVGDTELVYELSAGHPTPAAGARLALTQGTSRPAVIDLAGRPVLVLGRDASCDVVIKEDSLVSRRHAQVRAVGLAHELEDLGSVNGVFVNGERVRTARLRPGDRIRLGSTEFTYRA